MATCSRPVNMSEPKKSKTTEFRLPKRWPRSPVNSPINSASLPSSKKPSQEHEGVRFRATRQRQEMTEYCQHHPIETSVLRHRRRHDPRPASGRWETVWMPQKAIAELFETSVANINTHIRNVLGDAEVDGDSVIKDYLITAADGKTYKTKHYNLDMILAIGYRVRSSRGVQFRRLGHPNASRIPRQRLRTQRRPTQGRRDYVRQRLLRRTA